MRKKGKFSIWDLGAAVALGGILLWGGLWASVLWEYHKGQEGARQLRQIAYADEKETSGTGQDDFVEIDEIRFPEIDEETLRKINGRYVCWLMLPGADIHEPVVWPKDNYYYLSHTFQGEEAAAGAVFADFRCQPFSQKNTVIYGHNMKDGSRFAGLKRYAEEAFYWENPQIFLCDQGEWISCPIFSCQLRPVEDEGPYQMTMGEEQWEAYLENMRENSLYETEAVPGKEDQLLTLSTCWGGDRRMVVQAVIEGKNAQGGSRR